MQVSMRDIEKTEGLFRKTVTKGVALNVTFTPDELKIIEEYELGQLDMPSLNWNLDAKELRRKYPELEHRSIGAAAIVKRNGTDYKLWFENRAECEIFKSQVKEDLQNLKKAIEAMAQASPSEQFEL
jgi:hypothetical protein